MSPGSRGFRSALDAPLLQAGWDLEAAKQDIAIARRALQDGLQLLNALQRVRGEQLAYCLINQGSRVNPETRAIQLTYLAEIDARLAAARCSVEEGQTKWTTAVARCTAKQQKLDHLNEVQNQQRIVFELEQRRRDARYADDNWLMRRPLALIREEAS